MLVEAVACLFKGERLDLSWITPHESLPVPSPPVIRYTMRSWYNNRFDAITTSPLTVMEGGDCTGFTRSRIIR
jgi:hypothetical protein